MAALHPQTISADGKIKGNNMTKIRRSTLSVMLLAGIMTIGAFAAPQTQGARLPRLVNRPGAPVRPFRPLPAVAPIRPMAPVRPMAPMQPSVPVPPMEPVAPTPPAPPMAPYFARPAAPVMPNVRNFIFQNSPQRGYAPMFFQRY